ncbi:MAG: FAD-dependent oxidoreductase [Actinomycetota bacterium]|nr:FAD-dependent oxidoreductase [Actinomycetota bacterium]
MSGPRVIVVGAGVYGLAAARRLALEGADVTVLEAREAGGPFAASAGSSRVLRFEYGPDAHYTELVLRARDEWRALEGLLGETLYEETGLVWFAAEESRYLRDSVATSLAAGLPVRLLEPAEAVRQFPAFSTDGIAAVLHDEAGGVLHARRATLGLARLARDAGVVLREGTAVRGLAGGVVELADGSSERADQVLVTTGAWTRALLPTAPIRSTQQVNAYLRVQTAGLPVWIYDLDVYGLGDDGGAGLKVGGHAIGADVDPDDPAAREAPAAVVRRLADAARRRLPGLPWPDGEAPVRAADVCCYALTPTDAPIVDRLDEHTVVCAGFSGHGFKFAPPVAAGAADLVLGRQPGVDLAPFRWPA